MGRSRRDVLLGSATLSAVGLAPAMARVATSSAPALPTTLQKRFDGYCSNLKLVGAMLTVVRHGRLEGCHGFGKASVPFDAPVTPSTRFHIASISKHVTALGVLRLVEHGRVSLDDPVGKHVSRLLPWMNPLPVRLLLQHLSGIADYEAGFEWDRPFGRDALLKAVPEPIARPGETFVYSNSAYAILGWLIEAVSGKSYAAYVEEDLFRPAGLPLARPDAADTPVYGRAEPYAWKDGVLHHATRMEDAVSRMSDGGLLFSALDWAPWLDAIDRGRIVSPALLGAAYQPGAFASGRSSPYGFGWFLDQVRDHPVRQHTGGVPGFRSRVLRYPHLDLSVIFNTNTDLTSISETFFTKRSATFLEEVIEHYAPGATFLTLEGQTEPSARRATRLAAYLAGEADRAILAPELVLAEKAANRTPGPRIANKPTSIALLESYALKNGEASRYRIVVDGISRPLLIGWSTEDQIYFVR